LSGETKSLVVKSEKGETKKMLIAEIRSALAADFEKMNPRNGGFPSAPDWAVKRMWEQRSGLPFSPLPAIALRNLDSFLSRAKKRAVSPAVAVDDDPNGEKEKLRIRLEALKLL
jgi:hypothetical protein